MNFKLGFLTPAGPNNLVETPGRMNTDVFLSVTEPQTSAPYVYSPDAQLINFSGYAKLCRMGCTATAEGFEIMIGIPLDNQGRADIWLFNDRRELIHVYDGIGGRVLN